MHCHSNRNNCLLNVRETRKLEDCTEPDEMAKESDTVCLLSAMSFDASIIFGPHRVYIVLLRAQLNRALQTFARPFSKVS